jgi:hypothetical protein
MTGYLRDRTLRLPFPEEPAQEGQEQTQQNTCGQRKIEREIFPLDHDIARKFSDKWNFAEEEQHTTNCDHGDAETYEHFSDIWYSVSQSILFRSKKYAG